jgi:hypothetical protein
MKYAIKVCLDGDVHHRTYKTSVGSSSYDF